MDNVRFKLFNDQMFSDCFINFAGQEKCSPGHRFGPAIRPCYIIHYILSGKGKFFCDNVEYDLCENQAFLIEPNAMTFIKRILMIHGIIFGLHSRVTRFQKYYQEWVLIIKILFYMVRKAI